ncbi:MAG: DUF3748 domain-containing protein [Verrucomicrobiota bacterium]|jgi:hypothetical protein
MITPQKQITHSRAGHILTNTGAWSPDGQWIVYDTRSDPAGAQFDGRRIEIVNIKSGEVKTLFEAAHGAYCGAATFHPRQDKVIFILGPENPSADWQYNAYHRQGVIVEVSQPGKAAHLDARDLVAPFTAGALRGGSHLHVWDAAGQWVSFTYEDDLLSRFTQETAEHDINLRNVGVSLPDRPVRVPRTHPRNQDGSFFSVLVTRTTANPRPGSDQISRACEEGWVGTNGYARADGQWQRHALAFQGLVATARGQTIAEAFIVDLPEDLARPGDGPLAGTETRRPSPPRGVTQRRLTHTADRPYPGLQGPRHWLHSAPDGSRIACLMKAEHGLVQLWTLSPNGGVPAQLTHNPWPIGSAFTWSPDGRCIAHTMDNSVCVTNTRDGSTSRLTARTEDAGAPRPEACVFSPDGRSIAFVRPVPDSGQWLNQIFVVDLPQ